MNRELRQEATDPYLDHAKLTSDKSIRHIIGSETSFIQIDNCTSTDKHASHTQPAADLGMFSIFGRTGAPTERGPHKRSSNFFMLEKMGDPRVKRRVMSKKSRQFLRRSDS